MVGVNHRQRIGSKAYLNAAVGVQTAINRVINDTVDLNFENPFTTYLSNSAISRATSDVYYNRKFNPRHLLKVGLHTDFFFLNLNDSTYNRQTDSYQTLRDFQGNTFLIQPYAQYQLRATENLTFNLGAHLQTLTLENQLAVEPRLGALWKFTSKDQLSFGYGLHSQMQPIELYFIQTLNEGGCNRTK